MRIVIAIEDAKAQDIAVQGVRAADLAAQGQTEHLDVDAGPAADLGATVVQLPRLAGSPELVDLDAGEAGASEAGAAPIEDPEGEDES